MMTWIIMQRIRKGRKKTNPSMPIRNARGTYRRCRTECRLPEAIDGRNRSLWVAVPTSSNPVVIWELYAGKIAGFIEISDAIFAKLFIINARVGMGESEAVNVD
jgi:hypothetical protein